MGKTCIYTSDQYRERMYKMRKNIYIYGRRTAWRRIADHGKNCDSQ